MKKIFAIGITIIIMVLAIVLDSGISGLLAFWNAPSALIVILTTVPMLVFSDTLGDFLRCFKIALTKETFTTKEIKSSANAIALTIRLVYLGAIFGFLTGIIGILGHIDDPSGLGPAAAIALLTIYYAITINILLHAIHAKVKKELIYRK